VRYERASLGPPIHVRKRGLEAAQRPIATGPPGHTTYTAVRRAVQPAPLGKLEATTPSETGTTATEKFMRSREVFTISSASRA